MAQGGKKKYVTLSTDAVQPEEQCGQSPFSKDLREAALNMEELADHLKERARGVSRLVEKTFGNKK
ncbi:MAG: hypothetical protein KDJ16_14240 [Hyphomicrobiales bacterium]|nr:hypothetical protein [Hyphomicrobiales bacterium]